MRHLPTLHATALSLISLLALWSCATPSPLYVLNRETVDLADVRDDALALAARMDPKRILVVFDLDNTLLAMEQGLGSDQWYDWQKDLAQTSPCDPRLVADRFAVQGALYYASAMRRTQEDAAAVARAIQDAGIPVIALTSRGTGYRLQTFRELRRNGYDFRRTALEPAAGWPDDFMPTRGSRPARYEDGVFLTSGQHKGEMLLELLERTGTRVPAVVVMTDDKQSNLDAVIESLHPLGVIVHSWRFSGEDAAVAGFDGDAADNLWRSLEPALRALQEQLGPDNFVLPAASAGACQ